MPDGGGAQFSELGRSGLEFRQGIPQTEWLPKLAGDKWWPVVREMADNDAIVGTVEFAIEQLLRKASWEWQPPDRAVDEQVAQDQAEFANECLDDMSHSMDDTNAETLSMLRYGWALHEIVYKRRAGGGSADPAHLRSAYEDNRVGWESFPLRFQETRKEWVRDDHDHVVEFVQQLPEESSPRRIPRERYLLFRTTPASASPEGKSVFRRAWQSWYFKQRIMMIEAVGIERDLAGLPMAEVPWRMLTSDATAEEIEVLAEIKKILRNIRNDDQAGVVWPRKFDSENNQEYVLKLLSSDGRRSFNTDAIVTRYDQRTAMTVLADFILLGHQQVGTKELSGDKVDLFVAALEAWIKSIAAVYTNDAAPRLMRVNGMVEALSPKMVPGSIGHVDLKEIAEFLADLGGAGMPLFPDEKLRQHLMEVAGLPFTPETEQETSLRELDEGADDDDDEPATPPGDAPTDTEVADEVPAS